MLPYVASAGERAAQPRPGERLSGSWRSPQRFQDRESVLRAEADPPWSAAQHSETKQSTPGPRFRSSGGRTPWCGRSRIRTWEAYATDLQSAPIGRSGNLPGMSAPCGVARERLPHGGGCFATGFGAGRRVEGMSRSGGEWTCRSFVGGSVRGGGGRGGDQRRTSQNERPCRCDGEEEALCVGTWTP